MDSRIAAVAAIATLLISVMVPAASGTEGNANALQRFLTEARESARAPRSARTSENDSAAIAKLIDEINAAVRRDKRRMLSIITINTDVAATTLEQEKARTGLSFGDIYIAHSLALSTRKKFDAIMALKKGGLSWAQIARANKVTLKGSKELIEEIKRK